jgi:hypothetical protein
MYMEDIVDPAFSQNGYIQCTLALKTGGLGLRNCQTHASAAYIASFLDTNELVMKILKRETDILPPKWNAAMTDYTARTTKPYSAFLENLPVQHRQSKLSESIDGKTYPSSCIIVASVRRVLCTLYRPSSPYCISHTLAHVQEYHGRGYSSYEANCQRHSAGPMVDRKASPNTS